MVSILQTTFQKNLLELKWLYFDSNFEIQWTVLKGPVTNKPALDLKRAWHQTGNMPLSEPIMVWFTDA